MEMEDYLAFPAFGSSALKDSLDCPARCKGSHEDTAGTRMGTAIHTAILEPEKAHTSIQIPELNLATKVGKASFIDFVVGLQDEGKLKPELLNLSHDDLAENFKKDGKNKLAAAIDPQFVILTHKDYQDTLKVVESIDHPRHAAIRSFLNSELDDVKIENVGVVTLRSIGGIELPHPLKLKIRPDRMTNTNIMDIKTLDGITAAPRSFGIRCAKFKYQLSAAMYVDVAKAIDGRDRDFYWHAVEKRFPYCMTLIKATEEDLDQGRDMWITAARIVSQAIHSREWGGYMPPGVKYLNSVMPRWDWTNEVEVPPEAFDDENDEDIEYF